MSQSAMIDVEHLDHYVAGDQALRDEILAIYEEQVENWVSLLVPESDDQAWRDAAHALKGASLGVGAWKLGELSSDAEKLIGDKNDISIRTQMVEYIRLAVQSTIEDVRRLRAPVA